MVCLEYTSNNKKLIASKVELYGYEKLKMSLLNILILDELLHAINKDVIK